MEINNYENLSPEEIEKAFLALRKIHSRSDEIIRNSDGKRNYIRLSNDLKIHKTLVSSIQREAYKLKLLKKINGLYKKKPGILKYLPKIKMIVNNSEEINKKGEIKMKRKVFNKIKPRKNNLSITLRINEAQKMASAYQWLYVTENALRDLIRKVYGNPASWWNINKVPQKVIDDVEKSMGQEKYDSAKRADELEFTNLDQLKEIITKNLNWKDFQSYLEVTDKSTFRVKFEGALSPRNCIAHSAPLKEKDLKVIDVRFEDVLNMIK